jgi:hypothetical protein
MKRVVQGKSEPKCRICSSGKCEVWERAYEDYLNGSTDRVTGEKLTWPILAERASILSGSTLSVRSARRHADGHVRVTGAARGAELDEQAEAGDELLDGVIAEIDGLLEAGVFVSPEGLLSLQQRLYLVSLRQRLQRGDVPALTHDQGARSAAALISAAKKHQEVELLGLLTQGIGSVFQRAFQEQDAVMVEGEVVAELEPAGVVDAEVVAEDESESA